MVVLTIFVGVMFGLLLFFSLPFLAVALEALLNTAKINSDIGERVNEKYRAWGFKAFGRCLLVKRENAGYQLIATSYDDGVEKGKIGGAEKYWADPLGFMGRLYDVPFGVAHEASNIIGSPAYAYIGEELTKKEAQGQLVQRGDEAVADGGARYGLAGISTSKLVDMDYFALIVQGSATPSVGPRTESLVEKMYKEWDSKNIFDALIWLAAGGMGFGLAFLGRKLAGTLSGSGAVDTLPVYVGSAAVEVATWV